MSAKPARASSGMGGGAGGETTPDLRQHARSARE